MGADKGGTKSGGFFHLFDWNRKSRKKLFSSGSVSPGKSLANSFTYSKAEYRIKNKMRDR